MAKEDFWKEDSDDQLYVPPKQKRIAKSKKMEYDGWGSKPLIEFLKEIGKDTEKKISQQDLTTIVNEYVRKNNLIKPSKKKRVECDRWLHYLFGKKFVLRIKIHELLFPHLAENRDESSEDEDSTNSEEENGRIMSRKRKASVLGNKVAPCSKKVPETPKSCFASIIPENIKLVYLTRSLIQELLKDPVAFESKVVGSYVRIKSDPRDFSQKNSHQLLQVTGVRKAPECGNVRTEYFLQVPHLMKEIPVSMLSNESFKTEECEDLLQRIKAGSFSRPTVAELQRKTHVLHEVITKQGITKELSLLQNLIDRANEKGWRRELYEYLERKELLKKPAEQERLLLEVPNVIAEELEREVIVQEPAEDENDVCGLPQLDIVGNRADKPLDVEADISLSNDDCTDTAEQIESEAIVRKPAGLRQLDIVGNRAYIPFNIEADKSLSNDDFCSTDAAEQVQSEAIVRKPAEDEKSSMCCPPESTFAGTWADIPCDAIFLESAQNERNNICCSTQITISRTSADLPSDAVADNCLPNNNFCNTSAAEAIVRKPAEDKKSSMRCPPESTFAGTWADIPFDTILLESAEDERNNICCSTQITISRTSAYLPSDAEADNCLPNNNFCNTSAADVDREGNRTYSNHGTYVKETNGVLGVVKVEELDINMGDKPAPHVIELSDDDNDEEVKDTSETVDHPESKVWYYMDPQGTVQGPFSMVILKKWDDSHFFHPGFLIWKLGDAPVPLKDMISLMFRS
ncbi:hypothetical protein POM88_029966 [Heracleum sosnowskyi]|uniref:SWIB domain-containing protein n=1 Tax=Heracleum sosnowskyi TaxID=360622 RepID=A0AAD8MIY4_9APIA|nr:hypothetical protein POM88_029966 [Heracleum sosnowskyi]